MSDNQEDTNQVNQSDNRQIQQSKFPEKDVIVVMAQSNCLRHTAIQTLEKVNGSVEHALKLLHKFP